MKTYIVEKKKTEVKPLNLFEPTLVEVNRDGSIVIIDGVLLENAFLVWYQYPRFDLNALRPSNQTVCIQGRGGEFTCSPQKFMVRDDLEIVKE